MKCKKKKGITLLETVISFTILSVVLMPIFSVVISSVKSNKISEDTQKDLYLAQKYAEKFKFQELKTKSVEYINGNGTDTNTDTEIPKNKKVKIEISPYEPPNASSSDGYEDNIPCETKIILSKEEDKAKIQVQDGSKKSIVTSEVQLNDAEKLEYNLQVKNGGTSDENLYLNIPGYTDEISIEKSDENDDNTLILEMDSTMNMKLNLEAFNYLSEDFKVYLVQTNYSLKTSYLIYSFNSMNGSVQFHDNIFYSKPKNDVSGNSNPKDENKRKIEKVDIQVWDTNENKLLKNLTVYRTLTD